MSSGRLPSLRDAAPDAFGGPKKKTQLKFKPKAGTRRTKEEREASALKVKAEAPNDKKDFNKKNQQNRPNQQRQKRVPRYLNNTHVISSGPLAAGNFVGDDSRAGAGGAMMRRGFVKMEGDGSSLVQKGLLTVENDAHESDEGSDDEKTESKSRTTKFNMGREYKVGQDDFDEDEIESDVELDEEALQAKRIEELFPVRPVRVRHDDVDVLKKQIQETLTEPGTREPTPAAPMIKSETAGTLNDALENRRDELQDKLNNLNLDPEYQSIDADETKKEYIQITTDHQKLAKKIAKINDKPNKYMLFQLPYTLPAFQNVSPKSDETPLEAIPKEENGKDEGTVSGKKAATKKLKSKKPKKKIQAVPQEELTGRVGSFRVHQSGKVTVKIGGIVMEVGRGAETSFIQDLIALNVEDDEAPAVEYLGRIDDRIVVTPKF